MGITSDAIMTKANNGTVVDCAKYYAVRSVAWLGGMVFASIVGRRGPTHLGISVRKKQVLALSGLLALLAARLTELLIPCLITIVSARDQDLLQAIWLAAAPYVSSGQGIIALYLVVTGCACSAASFVFRSAHNAGEIAPSASGCGIDELMIRETRG